jgi:hypothetical protein
VDCFARRVHLRLRPALPLTKFLPNPDCRCPAGFALQGILFPLQRYTLTLLFVVVLGHIPKKLFDLFAHDMRQFFDFISFQVIKTTALWATQYGAFRGRYSLSAAPLAYSPASRCMSFSFASRSSPVF